MVDNKNNNSGDLEDNSDSGFDAFSDEYMSSVKEQMQKLTENPEMLQKAIAPFMKMQQQYMNDPEKLAKLMDGAKAEPNELIDIVKRIRARLIRLEKRLEEAGVIKPLQS